MHDIYLVQRNADTTEGRGPMVNDKAFTSLSMAESYVDLQPGTMGYCPKEGRIAYKRKHGDYGGCWDILQVPVYDTIVEAIKGDTEQLRRNALRKLTAEERAALGL
jgi:hypothetical protein